MRYEVGGLNIGTTAGKACVGMASERPSSKGVTKQDDGIAQQQQQQPRQQHDCAIHLLSNSLMNVPTNHQMQNQVSSSLGRTGSLPLPSSTPQQQATSSSSSTNHCYSSSYSGASNNGGLALAPCGSVNNPKHIYNWQASMTSVKERLAFMFNNDILVDVHFVVGKGGQQERISAHKIVLSGGSAVFDAMFNGAMATKQDEIELPDVEPAAFFALLKFLYSDEVQIGPETVMTTLYTAKKYAVPALEKACVEFLKHNLSSDNAFMLLTQARLFDESQLAALCLETIDKNTSEAFAAEGFTDIDLDTLCAVLERDTLGIREAKLFQAVVR